MDNNLPKTTIREWAESDRPREKLLLKGKAALSDAELIAILIGSGNTNESAVELSRRILRDQQENLIELSHKSVANLTNYKGIGEAKAISIIAALELGRRRRRAEVVEKPIIKSSKDAFEVIYPQLTDLDHEQFWIILLNQANKVIRSHQIGQGGITGTVADPRKIFKIAIEDNAAGMILCHNHPSGQLHPSEADLKLTKKMIQSGELLDIKVLDHLIVGQDDYYSFADNGNL